MELLRSYIWGCSLSGTACVCLYWMPRDNFQPISGSQFRVRIIGFNLLHCCCSHNGFSAWLACVLSHFRCIRLLVTLWAVAHQSPLSNGFSAKNVRVGYHAFFKGVFLTQGSNSQLFTSTTLADGFFTTSALWKALVGIQFKAIPSFLAIQVCSSQPAALNILLGKEILWKTLHCLANPVKPLKCNLSNIYLFDCRRELETS